MNEKQPSRQSSNCSLYNNVIRTEKRFDNVSDNHFRSIMKIFKKLCYSISERYNSIFEYVERIQVTRQKSL